MKKFISRLWFLTGISVALMTSSIHAKVAPATEVPVWIYHASPPFIVDEGEKSGLSFDLARLLSKRSQGRYQFDVEVLPRIRLDQRLAAGLPGVVFWANNVWFDDGTKIKYLWSSAVLRDENAVISPVSDPIEYQGPSSLLGKNLVSVQGHHYQHIDRLVDEAKIRRVDVMTKKAAFFSIASGHTDVSIQANSTAVFFAKKLDLEDRVHFSQMPHTRFERYVLVQPQMHSVFELIEGFARSAENDPEWLAILEYYGLGF